MKEKTKRTIEKHAIWVSGVLLVGGIYLAWPWIVDLKDSAAAFIGSMAGGAIGLFAILGGALYNAKLNRDRDDRLRKIERLALLEALVSELELFRNLLIANAKRARVYSARAQGLAPVTATSAREQLGMPAPAIYQANLTRLGSIGGRLTAIVAHAYAIVADSDSFVARTPDVRAPNSLERIAELYDDARKLVVGAHQTLLAEIAALGGPASTFISEETMTKIADAIEADDAAGPA